MAVAETARLIAALELDPRKFTAGADKALGKLGQMEGRFGKLGGLAAQGARNAAANVARIGVIAAGGVGLAVRGGISSLAELEDAVTSVDGAIAQVGPTWSTTGQQVATIANEIEASVQAAFDDKEITQAATTLIRYGKVSEENLRPSLVVMTDLAAKTGDMNAASLLLAKALADPEKAAGKLARTGIVLTKAQQDQIKAMVKAGDTAGAQKFLLGELEKATKGAAAASAGPYRDAMNILTDVTEDAQRALGEAFLPVLSKVADKLSKFVADPKNIEKIRSFGRDLASGFDKLLSIAGNIPWAQIGDSLRIAGAGGKALFDAFTMMPPWVQTAVLTGWGLNKLTGGALGGIVGELGKGLIKGVLGMNAAVVNINAGTVNGAGGAGAAAGGSKVGAAVGGAIIGGAVIQGALDVGTIATGVQRGYEASQAGDIQGVLDAQRDTLSSIVLLPPGIRELGALLTSKQQEVVNALNGTVDVKPQGLSPDERQALSTQRQKIDRQTTRIENMRSALSRDLSGVRQTTRSGSNDIVAAINRIQRPIVSVSVVGNTVRTTYATGGTVSRNVSTGSMNAGLSG